MVRISQCSKCCSPEARTVIIITGGRKQPARTPPSLPPHPYSSSSHLCAQVRVALRFLLLVSVLRRFAALVSPSGRGGGLGFKCFPPLGGVELPHELGLFPVDLWSLR